MLTHARAVPDKPAALPAAPMWPLQSRSPHRVGRRMPGVNQVMWSVAGDDVSPSFVMKENLPSFSRTAIPYLGEVADALLTRSIRGVRRRSCVDGA